MTTTAATFRLAAGRLAATVAIGWLIFLGVSFGMMASVGRQVNPVAVVTVTGMLPAYWVVFVWSYKATVGPDGIDWVSYSGTRESLLWGEITAAECETWLGLTGLHLYAPDGDATWRFQVPLTLADPHGFRAAVRDHAGPDHPLTVALG